MKDYYTSKQGFKDQIAVLEDSLKELNKFSVWQDDVANEELKCIARDIETIKRKLKPTPTCPNCYKAKLTETTNHFANQVTQRVVGCDRCGWVYSFNTGKNWREVLNDDLSYLGYCVEEGALDEGEAKDIIKQAKWGEVNRMRGAADAYMVRREL